MDMYLPQWMINCIHPYNKFFRDANDEENNFVNITRFIKEELKLIANNVG